MNKFLKYLAIVAIAISSAACTRIETGEVGLRINASKQIEGRELTEGSWNQTLWGSVQTFPIRDIVGIVEDAQPLTSETIALAEFDATYTYSINPSLVSEIYSTKSKSFHAYPSEGPNRGDVLLMGQYMNQTFRNAMYEVVRDYPALNLNDKRAEIENKLRQKIMHTLAADKLDSFLTLSTLQVRKMLPPASILESSAAVVRAENDLKVKTKEVAIAEAEAKRMQALSSNSQSSIAYMDAQARLNISTAVLAGKVNTIVIPADFKGFVNVK